MDLSGEQVLHARYRDTLNVNPVATGLGYRLQRLGDAARSNYGITGSVRSNCCNSRGYFEQLLQRSRILTISSQRGDKFYAPRGRKCVSGVEGNTVWDLTCSSKDLCGSVDLSYASGQFRPDMSDFKRAEL